MEHLSLLRPIRESILLCSPTFPKSPESSSCKLKPQVFKLNQISTKSTIFPQFLCKRRNFILTERGRGGSLFRVLRTMDGDGENDDKGEAERNGALEQEQNPLFGGYSQSVSSTVCNGLHPTLNRLSKWLVAALVAATILLRHDAEALWAAMGSVLNTALSAVLKRILNQERPNSAISSGPGMPSSHAQSILYAVIFLICSLIEWLGVNDLSMALSTMVLACGCYLSWLRVSQQYHTISQVAVGAAIGSGFASLWLWLWQAIVASAFASSLWVRLVVVVFSAIFCLRFLVHVIRHWLREEQ